MPRPGVIGSMCWAVTHRRPVRPATMRRSTCWAVKRTSMSNRAASSSVSRASRRVSEPPRWAFGLTMRNGPVTGCVVAALMVLPFHVCKKLHKIEKVCI